MSDPHPAPHEHVFLGAGHARNERRTLLVVALTVVTMVVEIAAGIAFNSMALLADGLHMATHAGALGIAAAAYAYARRHAEDPAYAFGTGKVGDLAAFASAVVLAVVAFLIAAESVVRLLGPVTIRYEEAIVVAILGLAVNLVSAWLLHGEEHDHHGGHGHGHHGDDDHDHGQGGHHDHDHHGGHADHNLRAAYLHVLADAATSVLAILGLLAGRHLGWAWLDPVVAVLGAVLIARWSIGLLRQTGAVLLDAVPDPARARAIRTAVEAPGDAQVTDLHLWRVGPGHQALVLAIAAAPGLTPAAVKRRLGPIPGLSHVTVELSHAPVAAEPALRRAA